MGSMEIARFTVAAADEGAVLDGHAAVVAALADACPGLRTAMLTRTADGRYVHVLTWRSHAEAVAAAERAPSLPVCAAWFALLAEPSLEHAEILDTHVVAS